MKSMKSSKGISVIIPTFNRAKFLYATLVCLLNQDISIPYEILIIDSGNDKETPLIIKSIQNKGCRILNYYKIKNCKNRSLLRNTGAQKSQYDILCFLDNDILVPQNFLSNVNNYQAGTEKQVLLFLRRFLTDFDINCLGEEFLTQHFNELEKLPYYCDERYATDLSIHPWRYAFSHTLIVNKNDFRKISGFDKKFGNKWGLEDIELGYRFAKSGYNFKYITDNYVYHQPHFTQSQKQQKEVLPNQWLFLKLHNSVESELEICFCNEFVDYLNIIKKIPVDISKYKKFSSKFDVLIALPHFMNDGNYSNKIRCGIALPYDDKSKNTILITDNFYKFPRILQMSMLSEASRVAKQLFIQKTYDVSQDYLKELANWSNFYIDIKDSGEFWQLIRLEESCKGVISFLLPDVLQSEKRFVYSWLSRYMQKLGFLIQIRDLRKIENLEKADFKLPDEEYPCLIENIERSFACTQLRYLSSFETIYENHMSYLNNSFRDFLVIDNDYDTSLKSILRRKFENSITFDESCYQIFSFNAVLDYVKNISPKNADEKNILCFMENGFLEDGIDIVLKAFSEVINQGNVYKLTIKMPDYNKLFDISYPRHSDNSRQNKITPAKAKLLNDRIKLEKLITELNLQNFVKIIEENQSIMQIANLVNDNSILVSAGRGCIVPPQVYIAMLLKKNVIIGKNHQFLPVLTQYCNVVSCEQKKFAQSMGIAENSMNLSFVCNEMNENELKNVIRTSKAADVPDDIIQALIKPMGLIIKQIFFKETMSSQKEKASC